MNIRYLVHGGELFQTQEAVMSIKQNCADNGYTKNEVFDVGSNFDWSMVNAAIQEMDMFAEKQLLELRLNAALTKSDQKAFEKVLDLQTQETVILVVAKKLSAEVFKEGWVKKLLQHGEVREAKNIPSYQWPLWVAKRLQNMHIQITEDASQLLIKSYEGNLFELNQTLLNLKENHPDQLITVEICNNYVKNSNIFSIFELSAAILQANQTRILTILDNFKDQGIEPSLILWSITKELRLLIKLRMEYKRNRNITDEALMKKYNIWQNNLPKYKSLLKKNTLPDLQKLIAFSYKIDLTIKGAECGNIFELLTILCVKLVSSNVLVMSEE